MATVKLTPELVDQALAETDWAKVDATTDAELDRQIATDPDTAPITLPSHVATALVARVQASLRISQSVFAARFGIPVETLQAWEQNRSTPDRAALSYLRVIAAEPDLVARALNPA